MTAIVWFRRDLRLRDHPALQAAVAAGGDVVPLFVLDDRLLHGRHASGSRTQFMLERLADLDRELRDRGARLVVRHGLPERELAAVARATGAQEVHVTGDVSPFDRARAARIGGLRIHAHPGLFVVDELPGPYRVFTAFYRRWLEQPRRAVRDAPDELRMPAIEPGRIPAVEELGLQQELAEPKPRLGAHLHLGSVSAREAEERVEPRDLAWRDFFHQVLLHNPGNVRHELQEGRRGMEWVDDDAGFEAWCEGLTGFPMVDAAMRQLRHEGFMPNRMRLLVASFVVKDLGIDWRRGERWFMRWLLDGDEANNNGNWQWVASVGTDPAPWWRRHYSPDRHRERYDPDGSYVGRWIPELESGDYPEPIIDRRAARAETAERYRR
jgi:deoxyribodipyrimidine photo-lyase